MTTRADRTIWSFQAVRERRIVRLYRKGFKWQPGVEASQQYSRPSQQVLRGCSVRQMAGKMTLYVTSNRHFFLPKTLSRSPLTCLSDSHRRAELVRSRSGSPSIQATSISSSNTSTRVSRYSHTIRIHLGKCGADIIQICRIVPSTRQHACRRVLHCLGCHLPGRRLLPGRRTHEIYSR